MLPSFYLPNMKKVVHRSSIADGGGVRMELLVMWRPNVLQRSPQKIVAAGG